MAIQITDECINCGACEPVCPNNAIYKGEKDWAIADGTSTTGLFSTMLGEKIDVNQRNAPLSNEVFYIVADKCTECVGFHEEPQCISVCPVDCCIPDPEWEESEAELLQKKNILHSNSNI